MKYNLLINKFQYIIDLTSIPSFAPGRCLITYDLKPKPVTFIGYAARPVNAAITAPIYAARFGLRLRHRCQLLSFLAC